MTREKKPKDKPKIKPKGNSFTPDEKANIIQAVESYMLLGYDLKKASIMARVSYSTVYMWYKADDSLRIRLDAAKWSVSGKARANLAKAVQGGDLKVSQYWLEKRDKDFEQRVVTEIKGFNFNVNEPSEGHKLDTNETTDDSVETSKG